MNSEGLDRWCERGVLVLVLAIMVSGPLAFGSVDPPEFLALQGLTLGVLLLWVARLWINPQPRFFWPPVCCAVLAFCLYAVARYSSADIEYVARQELIRVLVYGFVFLAILSNFQHRDTTHVLVVSLVFLGMGLSFYALWQYLTGHHRVWNLPSSYPHRASATFISPDHLAGFLEMILPLGLAFTLTSRFRPLTRVFLGYASLVILVGIGVTVSRGGWFSTAVSLFLFFAILAFHRTYRLASLALLALLLAGGFYFFPKSAFMSIRARAIAEPKAEVDRVLVWQSALRMWQDAFWFGVGPGHFDYRFRNYRPEEIQVRPEYAHNDYLNLLADWGTVGGLIVAAGLACAGVGAARTWRSVRGSPGDLGGKPGSNKFALVLGTSLGLVALLCHSLVDFNMHIPANALLATALLAMLTGHLRFATDRWWVTARRPWRALATVTLLAVIVYLGDQGWRRGKETYWLRHAQNAALFSPEQIECLKKAFAIEPKNGQTARTIGEAYRIHSQAGDSGYEQLAQQSLEWFGIGIKLNRWDDSSWLGSGWCFDWLGEHNKAVSCFQEASALDPNGYYTTAYLGVHYVALGDYAAAKLCFERSLYLNYPGNLIAASYLQIAQDNLLHDATNPAAAPHL